MRRSRNFHPLEEFQEPEHRELQRGLWGVVLMPFFFAIAGLATVFFVSDQNGPIHVRTEGLLLIGVLVLSLACTGAALHTLRREYMVELEKRHRRLAPRYPRRD